MRKFGLIGYPLSHSFSKKFFSDKFNDEQILDCAYELYPIADFQLLDQLLDEEPELEGINVTIPYKLEILSRLQEIDEAANEIGAVNCVKILDRDGKRYLKGFNTDAYGFESSIRPLLKIQHTKALVFGDGGAAKAVKYVLKKLNIAFQVVSRKPQAGALTYSEVSSELLKEYTVLINTTPLGMSPNIATCPNIPYESLSNRHLAYDLVYNPEETMFLRNAAERGAVVKNGLEMLYLQAERSWFIWNH